MAKTTITFEDDPTNPLGVAITVQSTASMDIRDSPKWTVGQRVAAEIYASLDFGGQVETQD
jgi:hypothetical protein